MYQNLLVMLGDKILKKKLIVSLSKGLQKYHNKFALEKYFLAEIYLST